MVGLELWSAKRIRCEIVTFRMEGKRPSGMLLEGLRSLSFPGRSRQAGDVPCLGKTALLRWAAGPIPSHLLESFATYCKLVRRQSSGWKPAPGLPFRQYSTMRGAELLSYLADPGCFGWFLESRINPEVSGPRE